MLFALSENDVREGLSLLEKCDAARMLHVVFKYPQKTIRLHMGHREQTA